MNNLRVYEKTLVRIKDTRYGDLSKVAAGQIWLVPERVQYPDGMILPLEPDGKRPNMVVVMGFEDDFKKNPYSVVRVFPVSRLWLFAGPYDLAFSRDNSPLKEIPLMIECWNPKPMLRTNLFKPIAKLDQAAIQDVEELQSADLYGKDPGSLKSIGYTGRPIRSKTDPRLKFQRNEVERTQFLNAPVVML